MDKKQITKVVTDSTTDLSHEIIEKLGITVVPLSITLNNDTYRDGVDVNSQMIFDNYKENGTLPKTAAPSIYDFTEVFKALTKDGYEVVFVGIGDGFSCTYGNATMASKEFDNVYTVNSGNLSSGGGHLALYAGELAKQGLTALSIRDELTEKAPYVDSTFIIEKLEFLHKGGRCSAIAMYSASALKLKPCIEVREGKMGVGKKYRGSLKKCIGEYIKDSLADKDNIDPKRCFITHTIQDRKILEYAYESIQKEFAFDEIIETNAGSTIASHCGEGTLGILFYRKKPVNIF